MMDSSDVSNKKVYSPFTLAASHHMHEGLSLLSISNHKRSSNFGEQSDDVNKHPPSSSFLHQQHHQRYPQQSSLYFTKDGPNPEQGITFESVSFTGTWREAVFPITVLTISVIGIIGIGIALFLWFKQNFKKQDRQKKKISEKVSVQVGIEHIFKELKMSEHDHSEVENIAVSVRSSPLPCTVPDGSNCRAIEAQALPERSCSYVADNINVPEDPPANIPYKNNSPDNLATISSPYNRRAHAKSANKISLINTSPPPLSPSKKTTDRKLSFNQSTIHEPQHQYSSMKTKPCAKSASDIDNLLYFGKVGTNDECLISKIGVLRGDVCSIQPPQLRHSTIELDCATISSSGCTPIASSPKIIYTQISTFDKATNNDDFLTPLSDNKENLVKCVPPYDTTNSRTTKGFQRNYPQGTNTNIESQTPSSKKILTQSPIFFANEQNSPNVYDSSSSPTLIPSLTPSSASSSATSTATNTTPSAALNSCNSSNSINARFIFSPKVIKDYSYQESPQCTGKSTSSDVKFGNSYFRFPEVDTFTPPNSAQVSCQSASTKTAFKIPSLVTSWLPSIETSAKELPSSQQQIVPAIADSDLQFSDSSEVKYLSTTGTSDTNSSVEDENVNLECETRNPVSLSNRASRRVRLKSISLDSEGARLVEENLTTGIPVEELVEIAANQTHLPVSENQIQLQSLNQSQMLNNDDETNSASCRKQRNIFNLTLNLNDKDETLLVDDDYKFNEFYFEYYDYDDEEDEEYDVEGSSGACYSERRKKQHSQLQTPRTPTLTQTRKKASSLDSDQSLNYLLPQPVRIHCAMDKSDSRVNARNTAMNPSTTSIRTSSLSVPTTPKRQPYRLQHPQQQQQHQQYGKHKQVRCINNDPATSVSSSPASERHHLCGFQQKLGSFEENADNCQSFVEGDGRSTGVKSAYPCMPQQTYQALSVSSVNLKTLPEILPVCNFTEKAVDSAVEKAPIQTLNKSRSSILQRRGSNHSLTLNLDASSACGGLSKGLSTSNYSLGNYKGSHLSLAGSSYNLQQQPQHQMGHQSTVQVVHTKNNLLQRRGSNTSLILNLQGSSSSLNRYNSHSSLNIQNQQNIRPMKKGLLERRNSNTSLTLINTQNRALSVSNCNIPGSICSLNSMATYQTQNEPLMLEEEEHSLAANNNQATCCNRSTVGAGNESHLSPNCQQHSGRRKFLSSDSLHNITNTRAGCCCQQKETNMVNPQVCFNRQMENYGGSSDNIKHKQISQSSDCSCSSNKKVNGTDKMNTMQNDMFKFKSTVTSTASTNNLTQFTCCDCCCCNCADALVGGVNTMSISNTNVRKITTKPLSPQTTSEDFKIYLANIQFLQNASNMLTATYMRNLHIIFKRSYGRFDKSKDDNNVLPGANNDVKLTNLAIVTANDSNCTPNQNQIELRTNTELVNEDSDLLSDEEQKKMILKIHQEFWDLPTNYQEKPLVFGSQSKNRYKTILPNEHSRVILKAEPGVPIEPYINANFIKGSDYTNNSYIATQGPMTNTIYEFWLMIHQNVTKAATSHNSNNLMHVEQKLIMLTDFVENNRQKCSIYFPQDQNGSVVFSNSHNANTNEILENSESIIADVRMCKEINLSKQANHSKNFNYFLITNVGICRKNGYTMRKLLVIYSYHEPSEMLQKYSAFTIYHYWFPDWPDHRSPEDVDVLLDMSLDILDNDCSKDFSDNLEDPLELERIPSLPIIHCSAGIGRTGCLLAILNGLSQIRSSHNASQTVRNSTKGVSESESVLVVSPSEAHQHPPYWNIGGQICVDILGIVCNLRLQRGGMVQNSEQYELIHRALCLYTQKLSL